MVTTQHQSNEARNNKDNGEKASDHKICCLHAAVIGLVVVVVVVINDVTLALCKCMTGGQS